MAHKANKDYRLDKKMKPYSSDRTKSKFALERFRSDGNPKVTTKTERLEIKNANRSLKKGVRQQAKKDIEEQLKSMQEFMLNNPE